jgi:hypothetical protein
MQLNTFIQKVSYAVKGLDDDAPALGSDDWIYWVSILNTKKDELYVDTSKQWDETYEVIDLGTVSADAAPTFDLDDSFLAPANSCYILDAEDRRHDFTFVKPQEATSDKQQVFIAGRDPKTLYFSKAIVDSDTFVGGTLYLPAYVLPDDVDPTNGRKNIPLPDANWGVYAVAAEVAASDLSYEDKAPDLQARANNLYSIMTKNTRRGTYGNPRTSKTRTVRIGERHSTR